MLSYLSYLCKFFIILKLNFKCIWRNLIKNANNAQQENVLANRQDKHTGRNLLDSFQKKYKNNVKIIGRRIVAWKYIYIIIIHIQTIQVQKRNYMKQTFTSLIANTRVIISPTPTWMLKAVIQSGFLYTIRVCRNHYAIFYWICYIL